ncbi:hypothetical protein [Pseudomonas sp. RC10]|uniref:hypothetical protein n=1 Tax=Pseudomonas bambusae TaxID=3139142 RepID=UPI003138F32A
MDMQVAPKRKAEQIFDARNRIETELYRSFLVDEMSIARLLRDIKSALRLPELTMGERASLYGEMAHLYGYKRDSINAIRALESAANLDFDGVALALDRSITFYMCGDISDAVRALETIDMTELSDEQIAGVMPQAEIACAFDKFGSAYFDPRSSQRSETLKILEAYGVTGDDLIARLDSVAKMISKEIDHPLLGYECYADSEHDCFLYRFAVRKSIPEIVDLNQRIVKHRLEHFDDPIDMAITINAMPFTPEVRDDPSRIYHVGV